MVINEPTLARWEIPDHPSDGVKSPFVKTWMWYNVYALQSPAARKLAERLRLRLPNSSNADEEFDSLMKPIKHLVIADEDTSQNMEFLLGASEEAEVKELWKKCRINCLLCSLEEQGTKGWKLREPTEEEKEMMEKVREGSLVFPKFSYV